MSKVILWFNRDLRLHDNPALFHAAQNSTITAVYIFDSKNPHPPGSAQKWWLHHSLTSLASSLKKHNIDLILLQGNPAEILPNLAKEHNFNALYFNKSYEPYDLSLHKSLTSSFDKLNLPIHSYHASYLIEPTSILNNQGSFFKVFTPFWKTCLKNLPDPTPLPVPKLQGNNLNIPSKPLKSFNLLPSKPDWAKNFSTYWTPGESSALHKIDEFINIHLEHYSNNRDFPSINATSTLSPHLHFGEISPLFILKQLTLNNIPYDKFLSELGWREFSNYLLFHFPDLPSQPFNPKFKDFPWANDSNALTQWQKGMTGYPIVDAGMRELWHTGYMHNRVRMITASFLTKHLLIPWQKGAHWFWDTLLDADLANNSASWQWVAGCGADAAPYFRIFNPIIQSQKFDPQAQYLRKWVPEIAHMNNKQIHTPWEFNKPSDYPDPLIDHNFARNRALESYEEIK